MRLFVLIFRLVCTKLCTAKKTQVEVTRTITITFTEHHRRTCNFNLNSIQINSLLQQLPDSHTLF